MVTKWLVAVTLLGCPLLQARLTRIVIEARVAADIRETVTGHFFGELDPASTHNSIITDLNFAPRNANGKVEYSATFAISKPVDMSNANGVLFYSVPNRGNGTPAPTAPGEVSVVSGWQGDLTPAPNRQTINVPIARNPDGAPLTGPVFERFINMAPGTTTLPFVSLLYQRPLSLNTSQASLLQRSSTTAQAVPVPASDWAFADCTSTLFPGTPDPTKICAKAGFNPAFAYELVFTAKDPLVLGIGYAATRDLNSFLRYSDKDDEGNPNPVAKRIRWAVARGTSQSGNFIRSFIHLGFNQDESDRIVWDGVNPHIAARQLALNYRFAVAGGAAGLNEPGSDGVVWWSPYADSTRNREKAGLLSRCTVTRTCPKVIETFGSVEFWYLRESADLVGTDAKSDIPVPPNVRRYFLPATSHGGGPGGFNVAGAHSKTCVLPLNPNPETETMRAITLALIEWVTSGTEPPPSRYPKLEKGELVPAAGFSAIAGAPSPNGLVNLIYDFDFGPMLRYNDLSGVITKQPPAIRKVIPTLVPQVDEDGMDIGGVPSVLRQAPLGSYLGWNVTAAGFDKCRICGLSGGYVPFAATKAERLVSGDTRLSLEERYATHQGYVVIVRKAADEAVAERFLLPADAAKLIAEASASKVLTHTRYP